MNLNFTSKWSKLFTMLLLFLSSSFSAMAQGDLCTDPITISAGTHVVDTLVGEGAVQTGATAAKWYSYTPASNVVVTTSSCLGGTDTRLWIWSGGCDLTTNTLEAANDDFCEFDPGSSAWASETSFLATGGTEYLINWDDRWSTSGFTFSLTEEAPPMIDVTVSVDMSTVMTSADGAYIAGDFNGWTGEPMTDNGDDTYTFTITGVTAGNTVQYKFQNGPGGWENDFTEICGLNNNRFFEAPLESTTLPIVPFNACFFEGESCLQPIVVSEGVHVADSLIGAGAVQGGAVAAKWYSYTPTESGFANVNSCLGGTDTRLYVWTGGCDLATNTLVAQNDDFCEFDPGSSAWASQVEFEVVAGTEYLINWDDRWDPSGFTFSITLSTLPPDPTCEEPAFVIQDDIESYDLGDINGAAGHWGVWTGATSSGVVSEDFAASGTKSVKIDGNIAGQDALLFLNNASDGHYWVGWKMYVPEGNIGYFNLQHDPTPGAAFGFEATLGDEGDGNLLLSNQDDIPFTYPQGEWFDVILFFDIANDEARMVIGDITVSATTVAAWGYTDDSTDPLLSAINFWPSGTDALFYVDDVAFALLPEAGTGEYCYTATAIDAGTHTVGELSCFGAAYFLNDGGFAGEWFSYTPTEDGFISISSCGAGADTRGWIFEGDCHSLSTLGVNDDMCDLGNGSLWASYREAAVTAGNTYYILWDDMWETTGFDFELAFTAGDLAAGEFCESAIPVSAGVDIFTETFGDAAVAGPNIGNYLASTTPYAQSAWHTWTAPFSGTAEITSCDAGTDTRVWVYTGACGSVDDLELQATSDDDCGVSSFIGDWEVTEGTTYIIEWDNENDGTPFSWRINYNTPQYTFNVDMNLQTVDAGGVFIAGSFNGFSNTPMADDDGDGVYTATVAVPANSDITYKFKNGPDGWENIDNTIGDDCTVGDFADRGLTTGEEDEIIDDVCFNYCVACSVVDVDEIALSNGVNVFPNPATDQVFVQFDLEETIDVEVRLVNTLGQIVSNRILNGVQGETVEFNVSNLAVGTYFIQFVTDEASVSQKVILQD